MMTCNFSVPEPVVSFSGSGRECVCKGQTLNFLRSDAKRLLVGRNHRFPLLHEAVDQLGAILKKERDD
jgi:hypothetical protein